MPASAPVPCPSAPPARTALVGRVGAESAESTSAYHSLLQVVISRTPGLFASALPRTLPGEIMSADPSHAAQQPVPSPKRSVEEPEGVAKRVCREAQDAACFEGAEASIERGCAAGPRQEAEARQAAPSAAPDAEPEWDEEAAH